MAITLAEAKVGMADKVDQQVVDEFRRSSLLLDSLVFDNSISPGTGGSTLTYGYMQLKTPSTAGVRAINTEYTPSEAKREKKSSEAIVMGGAFEVDRVIANTSGAVDELAFQAQQKIKATANYFSSGAQRVRVPEARAEFPGASRGCPLFFLSACRTIPERWVLSMRLMKADMQEIRLLRAEIKKSGYIGTAAEYKSLGAISGQVSPASDSYSIATYGERVAKMYSVTVEAGADVRDGDKLVIYGEECKVISVMRYSTHITITAERTGIYGH